MNLNQKGMDALLGMASKKVGTSPQNLKNDLEKGNLDNVMKGMNPSDSKKLKETLSNKQMMDKIMNSPEAQALMKKFSDKK